MRTSHSKISRPLRVKRLGFVCSPSFIFSHFFFFCTYTFSLFYFYPILMIIFYDQNKFLIRYCKFLIHEETKTLVHVFVTSRVDYCNSLLCGLPVSSQLNKVQRVLSTAARLFCCVRASAILHHWCLSYIGFR